jgi:hypothetical protein
MAIIVIKNPKPTLLIPASSIPNKDEKGAKKEEVSPNMKFIKNRTGKEGILHTNNTFSFTL